MSDGNGFDPRCGGLEEFIETKPAKEPSASEFLIGRVEMIRELLSDTGINEDGNVYYKKPIITSEQARELLGFSSVKPKEPAVSEFFKASDFASKPVEMKHAATAAGAISCTSMFGPDFAEAAASIANRLLKERGTVVECAQTGINGFYCSTGGTLPKTHTAFLINIQPIEKPDTADALIKDLANHAKFDMASLAPNYWIERAKKLLENK